MNSGKRDKPVVDNRGTSALDAHCIVSSATVREALQQLNSLSGGNMTLFVVTNHKELQGSLTDGDIRRALTAGKQLDTPVAELCNRSCLKISEDSDRFKIFRTARQRGITLLPVVKDGQLTALEDLRTRNSLLPLDAVLMAGGRGERLRPLTLSTPKPLLNIGGKPIIDYNIDLLHSYGIDNIFVTVNYLKEQLIEHFSCRTSGETPRVECVTEPTRLGTMGSLSLIDNFNHDDIIVMNSDLLTTIDFEKMFLYHKESNSALTMGAVPYNVSVPYAIVEHRDGVVKGLTEKPTYTYLANAGIYMMRRSVAEGIRKGVAMDAPDFIQQLIDNGERVTAFPIDGTWIDIGNPDDYATADRLMSTANKK